MEPGVCRFGERRDLTSAEHIAIESTVFSNGLSNVGLPNLDGKIPGKWENNLEKRRPQQGIMPLRSSHFLLVN